ncbi:MAG: CDP-alcohol phosphatidyltransferase family protein [Candidatus Glassbacteria bacterium]|nr:CDP-alcohol phosphatidyltransferase family protein [Candidatus Glassbacteria bacterium]
MSVELKHSRKVPIPYTRIRELNIFTLSNFLSLLRVLLLPFIYYSLTRGTQAGDYWACGLMLLAAATDILDGLLARSRKTISSFGKILDPLADKLCMGAIVIFLITLRGFPLWLVVLILARDTAIFLVGAFLIRHYKIVFPSNFWGKLYSFSVAVLIAAYTLRLGWRFSFEWAVLALMAVSSLSYGVIIFRYVRTHQRHQRRHRKLEAGAPEETRAAVADRDATGSQV